MSALILIRHSNSRQIPGISAHQWTLTDEGRERCIMLAEQLRPYHLARLASSDEPKATLTAELLREALGITPPVEVALDFRETRRETAPYHAEIADFQAAIYAAMQQPDALLYGEEAFTAARQRLEAALRQFVVAHPNERLGVVTHGTVMSMLLSHITGQPAYDIWQSLEMPAYAVLSPDLTLISLHPHV